MGNSQFCLVSLIAEEECFQNYTNCSSIGSKMINLVAFNCCDWNFSITVFGRCDFFCGTEVDVIFLQEVASNFSDFFQRSSLAKDFKCVSPPSILVNPEGFWGRKKTHRSLWVWLARFGLYRDYIDNIGVQKWDSLLKFEGEDMKMKDVSTFDPTHGYTLHNELFFIDYGGLKHLLLLQIGTSSDRILNVCSLIQLTRYGWKTRPASWLAVWF